MRTSEIFSTREEKFRKFKQLKCSMGRKECHKRKKKGMLIRWESILG